VKGVPRITADIVFLRPEEGGRVVVPLFNLTSSPYMPHIVIQDRAIRSATVGPNGTGDELYQGIAFVKGPQNYRPGESGRFEMELMYFPNMPYDDVQSGATFTVREGAKIVAHGVVLERH